MKTKTVFYCTDCGNETSKWQGRCPACGAWNTLKEYTQTGNAKSSYGSSTRNSGTRFHANVKRLSEIENNVEIRFSTGMGELNRVLGGGAVKGSLVLLGGTPGIGKSTLLLQICTELCKTQTVLYSSGEESEEQLKLRAERLKTSADNLLVMSETCLDEVLSVVENEKPDILIIDSIQTLYSTGSDSAPGSISQVRDCTMALLQLCKSTGITVFIVGHVNKEGAIAGPKVLEHMVDCVMYFEGDKGSPYRLLRAAKNRFGSTNEIGVFEMVDTGLKEVPNPSEALLAGRPKGASGTCVACPLEGTRPVLAEVQALVSQASSTNPRRAVDGLDYNRTTLLIAVLDKRAGIPLAAADIYLNVIGGLRLDEPATDLPVIMAIASAYYDKPLDDQMAAIGEVGLTGEIRSISEIEKRLIEISRLGFTSCVVPRQGSESISVPEGLKLIRVRNIRELFAFLY